MIRINLMPLEERGQKVRRVKKSKSGGGGGGGRNPMGLLLPIAIIAGVLVAIIGTIVQQQAQIHMLAGEVARVQYDPALFGDKDPSQVSPFLTVGVGLALRKAGDK